MPAIGWSVPFLWVVARGAVLNNGMVPPPGGRKRGQPAKAAKDDQDAEERPSKKARAEDDPIVAKGHPRRTAKAACRIPVTVAPKNKVIAPEKKVAKKS
ncbi:hypothetical protein B0H13DRAFT_2301807 [Mycena leptocephala]|nr:hypothetical protein B0H13DRAFT_2301807 [Mycena leptocephala]